MLLTFGVAMFCLYTDNTNLPFQDTDDVSRNLAAVGL